MKIRKHKTRRAFPWISARERVPEDGRVIIAMHRQLPILIGVFRKELDGYQNVFLEYDFSDQLCTDWTVEPHKTLGDTNNPMTLPGQIKYWAPITRLK